MCCFVKGTKVLQKTALLYFEEERIFHGGRYQSFTFSGLAANPGDQREHVFRFTSLKPIPAKTKSKNCMNREVNYNLICIEKSNAVQHQGQRNEEDSAERFLSLAHRT